MNTLFNIYEGAIENATSNSIEFTAQYVCDYADGALEISLSKDDAEKIIAAHNEWEKSDKGSHNFYMLVESVLEEIEV